MSASYLYEPVIQEFVLQNTITVTHNFGRYVNVSVYEGNTEIICDVENDPTDPLNKIIIKLYEGDALVNKTGRVVIS